MPTKGLKTYSAKTAEMVPLWHVIDATGKPLGRISTEVAIILQGKHRPIYTPHILTGDFVVVVNASQVGVTGRKLERKKYYHYSGYHGGLKVAALQDMLATHPERVIQHAVRGMLPKNALAKHMLLRLKVYGGPDHPHQAQVAATLKLQAKVAQPQSGESEE